MLSKRIIPCLDVKDGNVVKGVQFRDHTIVGDIVELAQRYSDAGADELVFYDITASTQQRQACPRWIERVARVINIPFCVAGGIRTLEDARRLLNAGADKFSLNTPALNKPNFINECVAVFGRQCVVIGIDSWQQDGDYYVYQYTGDPDQSCASGRKTLEWLQEVQARGAGEIVLNCMNQDGVRKGYDIVQLQLMRPHCRVPLIASGGAGSYDDFINVFTQANVDGALAASVFHQQVLTIAALKQACQQQQIEVRPC